VIGNPQFNDSMWSFPNLPGATKEADAVSRDLNTSPLKGPSATLAAVLERATARSPLSILYLATHAVADDTNNYDNNDSFAALANGDRLTIATIRSLKMAPRALVVLSACQTGLGSFQAAGVGGLARAFEANGASSVVMSFWSIDDDVTEGLMSTFIKQLTKLGSFSSVPGALRAAMLTSRTLRPNPAFWASFTVFGVEQFQ
jgi:CHAT domain-containing protein